MRTLRQWKLSALHRRAIGYSVVAVVLALIGIALLEAGGSSSLKPTSPDRLIHNAIDRSAEFASRTPGAIGHDENLINRAWSSALDEARGRLERSLGVFAAQRSGVDGDDVVRWLRVDELASTPRNAVVLIHGLDDTGTIWADLTPALLDAGHSTFRFDYPNDQGIARSAVRLLRELRELNAQGVQRVDFVCHSMGGLVAREVLTRVDGYAGRAGGHQDLPVVGRLIMVGTPNGGSELARFRAVMEIRDHLMRWIAQDDRSACDLLGFLVDGDGQAGRDLLPDSAFLERLNARPHPDDLAMTTIIGRAGGERGFWPLDNVDQTQVDHGGGRAAARYVANWVNSQLQTIGDGAVSASSAQLTGVDDVVYLQSAHRTLLKRSRMLGQSSEPPAIAVILDRLGTSANEPSSALGE